MFFSLTVWLGPPNSLLFMFSRKSGWSSHYCFLETKIFYFDIFCPARGTSEGEREGEALFMLLLAVGSCFLKNSFEIMCSSDLLTDPHLWLISQKEKTQPLPPWTVYVQSKVEVCPSITQICNLIPKNPLLWADKLQEV